MSIGDWLKRLTSTEVEEAQVPSDPLQGVTFLSQDAITNIVGRLNAERITRTMQLHDIRWIDEANQSFVPTPNQVYQEAFEISSETILTSRMTGSPAFKERRGFICTSYISSAKYEILNISYVLSSAGNLV